MDRYKKTADVAGDSPPSEAWLFAQAILGKPIPDPYAAARRAREERGKLERLAQISPRHADEFRKLESAEAEARRRRESLTWAAGISTEAEAKLRKLLREEAQAQEAQKRWERYYEEYLARITEWNPDQPRAPKGTPQGGQWVSKGGGGFLGNVIRRNQTIGDLTGIVTPGMVHSSRLAAQLQAAGRLPGEVAAAAADGLVTGSKAIVNGSATAVKNAATLGLSSSQLELIGVTKEDRERGYDTAVMIATASGQVLIAVGTSGITAALGKGGTVARTASGALVAHDAAGNAVDTVQGAYDAGQNGVNLENGLKIAGGSLGLAANVKAARGLSQAASAAELEKIDGYIAKCPRKPTPTKTAANQYEIAHTGPHNYTVSGGGAKLDIDGYRGTTILEAKHVGDVKSSPYLPGSSCPEAVRASILSKTRKELEDVRTIIRNDDTPFKSVEIITNTQESKTLFEGMLKEAGVPGTVRLAI